MNKDELYKMIRVAYGYGKDIPDSLIEYGIKKFEFTPIINLYKAGYRPQAKEAIKNESKTPKRKVAEK